MEMLDIGLEGRTRSLIPLTGIILSVRESGVRYSAEPTILALIRVAKKVPSATRANWKNQI